MRCFSLVAFFFIAFLGAGCTTSRVIEDTRSRSPNDTPVLVRDVTPPEIVIDKFGDVTFQGKRVAPEEVAAAVKAAGIPKKQKIRILVPEQRDHVLMRKIADNLLWAGYGTLFVTDKRTQATGGTASPDKPNQLSPPFRNYRP